MYTRENIIMTILLRIITPEDSPESYKLNPK